MPETDRPWYFNKDGQAIGQQEFYRLKSDTDYFRVDCTEVAGAEVSTVWLGHNHRFGGGPPLIFETMVFGGEYDNWCHRYSTEAQAIHGHDQVVAAMRDGKHPDEVLIDAGD